MFNQVINGVEVFEVGKQHLKDLLDGSTCKPHYLLDLDYAYQPSDGDYVVLSAVAMFEYIESVIYVERHFSCVGDAVQYAALAQLRSRRNARAYGYVEDYEVWHVVDDDDLWAAWEYEVGRAAVAARGTSYHLCDGATELEIMSARPSVVYAIAEVIPHLSEDTVLGGTTYYEDVEAFGEDLAMAVECHGCSMSTFSQSTIGSLGLYVVDDYSNFVDLDGVPVVTAVVVLPE